MDRAGRMVQYATRVIRVANSNSIDKPLRFVANAVQNITDVSDKRNATIEDINLLDSSDPTLFHRTITGRLREGNKRASRRICKEGSWILACVEGRNKFPDLTIQVPKAPLLEDMLAGRFALQKRGKTRFVGPLYELRIEENTMDEYGRLLSTADLPFQRLRALAHNIRIHPVGEYPLGVSFRYSPENEPVRVRVPVVCINQEKCPGMRDGGWLNRLQKCIDINVAPFTPAPQFVTMDVSGMKMKDKRFVGDLHFERKGDGCRTVLGDDEPVVVISK